MSPSSYRALSLARGTLYHLVSQAWRRPCATWRAEWKLESDRVRLALGSGLSSGASLPGLVGALAQLLSCGEQSAGFGLDPGEAMDAYETQWMGSLDEAVRLHRVEEISSYYGVFAFEPPPGEQVDHLAVELEFLHFLCIKEAEAVEHGDKDVAGFCREMQRRFLFEHLGKWAPSFCASAQSVDADGFLTRAAVLLVAWLDEEKRFFEANLRAVVPPRDRTVDPTRALGPEPGTQTRLIPVSSPRSPRVPGRVRTVA